MLSDAEIAALLEAGYESTSVEFKGPESVSSTAFVAKVARAAMAMANQRDGGHITIGLDEKDPTRRGLSRQQLNDWMDYDSVVDKINRFADPPLRVERAARKLPDGQDVVVLQVAAFLRTAAGAGVNVDSGSSDSERYDGEIDRFNHDSGMLALIGESFFEYTIRPVPFEAERVEFIDLEPSVARAVVRARGWPYPFVSRPRNGENWVAESSDVIHVETWAAFESGQFFPGTASPRTPQTTSGLRA